MIELTVANGADARTFTCEAVLFDMDGTLVDSSWCVERTWRLWAEKHRLDIDALLAVSHGLQNHETIRRIAPQLETPEEIAFLVRTEEECRDGIAAVPGAGALLDALAHAKWAVVTSAWRTLADLRLHCAGLPIPQVLVTADDVARSKPHPDGYLAAASRLGVAPAACVVVEDSPAGIESARAAGMTVIGITTTFPRERLACEVCVDDFRRVTVRVA
jgi:mannitol-1-/sugar-/sorbitol-6-phosphatase